jgi:excinuclease ABC subunit C
VTAALKAFVGLDAMPPAIVGLAKKEETIVFPDARAPLNLPHTHPGLNLLRRLRDEAHRFANTYNAELQSRKLRESVLDDCPGLGPKRKAALLAHFGSLEKIRAASAAEIAEVEGFALKSAAAVREFLQSKN